MMGRAGGAELAMAMLPGRQGWTIVQRSDPAMDLHLTLMVEAADEALRSLRAADEHACCRHKRTAPDRVNGLSPFVNTVPL